MKKVTLKDIAKELNVTVSTVSHVLNGINDISESTKQKVLQTADKLGYIANGPAAALRSGKTKTIAVIVPDISNPHIAPQVKLIEDKLNPFGYSVIIFNTNEDDSSEKKAITTAVGRLVDAIMLCPAQHNTKNIKFLKQTEIPFILIGRYFENLDTDYVCADDKKGGFLAGKYLLDKGCTKPMYIGTYKTIEGSIQRLSGLRDAFSAQNITIPDENIIEITPKADNLEIAVSEILNNDNVDSVVVYSDIIAFKIMSRIKCVKNLPVIGFDAVSSHLSLPFDYTSVGMLNNGWAEKAVEIIINKINGNTQTAKELIDVNIFEF